MGGAASAFAARHRGATARTVDVLMALLPEGE
jgi:3-deoxy-D-manno-octulosonic-acid transferase